MSEAPAPAWSLPILIAAPYLTRQLVAMLANVPRSHYRLMVDSGAFTAWKLGKAITVPDYTRFLADIAHLTPFDAVQLDIVNDPEGSWRNYLEQRELGAPADLLPVIQVGASDALIERAFTASRAVLLGGLGGKRNKPGLVAWLMRRAPPDARVHLLGMERMNVIARWRPWSVDSSGWCAAQRFGCAIVYLGQLRKRTLTREDMRNPTPQIRGALRALGLRDGAIARLAHPEAWRNILYKRVMREVPEGHAIFINALSHVALAYDIERMLGTRAMLSTSYITQMSLVQLAYRHFIEHAPLYRGPISMQPLASELPAAA